MRAHIIFGEGGNSQACQVSGFSGPEDGFTWSIDQGSRTVFKLAAAEAEGEDWVELSLNPHVIDGQLDGQHLAVRVNGVLVGDEMLLVDGTVGYRIPEVALGADGRVRVDLHHPRARRPDEFGWSDDDRCLGFMIRAIRVYRVAAAVAADITVLPPLPVPGDLAAANAVLEQAVGMDARALSLCFESLGRNCEFGLAQRQSGAEPLSLLRFAGITLENLLAGLRTGFAGVGEEVAVRPWPMVDGRLEYMVDDRRFHIELHSYRSTDETTAEAVHAEHSARLRFSHRQFARWLRSGERVFVFQRPGQLTRSQIWPLVHLLRSFGPCALLYVDETSPMPGGAVERLGDGLFHGRIGGLANLRAIDELDLGGWLSLMANTYRLWKG